MSRFGRSSGFVIVLSFAFATITTSQPLPASWKTVTSAAGGFTIDLPGASAESAGKNKIRSIDLRLTDEDAHRCLCLVTVTAAFYPVSVFTRTNASDYFKQNEQGFSSGASHMSGENLEIQRLPARRIGFIRDSVGGKIGQNELIVVAGNRVFHVSVFSKPGSNEIADRVFSSFKLSDPQFVNPNEWITVDMPEWGFSVKMPGFPERIQSPPGAERVLLLKNYAFELTATTVPSSSAHAREFLDQKQADLATAYQGVVTSHKDLQFAGATARRLPVSFNSGASRLDSLLLVKQDHVLFLMVVNAQSPGVDSQTVEKYFSSVALKY